MTTQPPEGQARRRRKLSAILMADVSGFSRMMGADEDATITLIREFHSRVKLLVEELEGRVIDTAGDSVLAEFDSVVHAVDCARRIQQGQAAVNEKRSAGERIETRIGVHLGDVVVEDYRVYGDGVNIAARLEPLADPGGICVSEAVYQEVRSRLDLSFEDLGLRELKNIEHPIRVYKVPGVGRRVPPVPLRQPRSVAIPSRNVAPRPRQDDFLRVSVLVPTIVGILLLVSPVVLFPTAGAFPTLGAVLLAVTFGRIWVGRSGKAGNLLIALGAGIASGAIWTSWSHVTDVLFLFAGVIVAAIGFATGRGARKVDFPGT